MKTGYLSVEDGSLPWMLYVVPQVPLPPLYVVVKLVRVCAPAVALQAVDSNSPMTIFATTDLFMVSPWDGLKRFVLQRFVLQLAADRRLPFEGILDGEGGRDERGSANVSLFEKIDEAMFPVNG